jgi:hypothetical protein
LDSSDIWRANYQMVRSRQPTPCGLVVRQGGI